MDEATPFLITIGLVIVPPIIALVLRVMSTRKGRPTRWANWALIVFGVEIASILFWVGCVNARCYPEMIDQHLVHFGLWIIGVLLTTIGLVVYFETPSAEKNR